METMMRAFYIKDVKSKDGIIDVRLEDMGSLNAPELMEDVLWVALFRLSEMGVIPVSFRILSFNIRNTPLYNVAKFMASKYERIRPLYKALKSSLNEKPILVQIPSDELDTSVIKPFINNLRQLSAVGILRDVHYDESQGTIGVEGMSDSYFLTGGWLELALADTITSLCPFRKFVLVKNLRFRFKNVNNEADIVLLSERGNFLFETKTTLHLARLESTCYRLVRIGNILDIPSGRIFLVVPSEEDFIGGDGYAECPGVDILTLRNLESVLRSFTICSWGKAHPSHPGRRYNPHL